MMVRKACQRAIDENVADLQKKYDQFRIKAPITEVDGGIKVQVGMKEGITPDSEFEVLEPQDENGVITYKRVAVIKPVDKKIWDNRYMAVEEGALSLLNEKLNMIREFLDEEPEVTITYFEPDKKKTGGAYITITGIVKRIDEFEHLVIMKDGAKIFIDSIYDLQSELFYSLGVDD